MGGEGPRDGPGDEARAGSGRRDSHHVAAAGAARWAIGAACNDLEAVCRRQWGGRVGLGDGGKYGQSRQFGD